jgi:hypothetical protein
VSSALAVISRSNAREKKNKKMSNAFSAMVTIQPTKKDAPSTKTYKREPSHLYETNRTAKNRNSNRKHKSNQASPTLLLLHLNKINMRLPLRKSISKQHTSSNRNCQQVTQELKVMMKGLMEQMGTMLSSHNTRLQNCLNRYATKNCVKEC